MTVETIECVCPYYERKGIVHLNTSRVVEVHTVIQTGLRYAM